MNGTQKARVLAWQLTRYVLFGQIAIVELTSCCPSASLQANTKREPQDQQGRTTNMENHETRRKIIRQWASLPKDKRQTAEQAAEFAKKADRGAGHH